MWKAGLLRSPIITPSESNNKIDSQTFIELRADEPNARIYFTVDGTKPDPIRNGNLYRGGFRLSPGRCVLKAITVTNDGLRESNVITKHIDVDDVNNQRSISDIWKTLRDNSEYEYMREQMIERFQPLSSSRYEEENYWDRKTKALSPGNGNWKKTLEYLFLNIYDFVRGEEELRELFGWKQFGRIETTRLVDKGGSYQIVTTFKKPFYEQTPISVPSPKRPPKRRIRTPIDSDEEKSIRRTPRLRREKSVHEEEKRIPRVYTDQTEQQGTLVPFPDFNVDRDCERLHEAMKSVETDGSVLVEILGSRITAQRVEICDAYKTKFRRDLYADLKGDVSRSFRKILVNLLHSRVEYDCYELQRAIKGMDADEGVLVEILASRSNKRLKAINHLYPKLFDRSLEEDIVSDISGHLKKLLIALLQGDRPESNEIHEDEVGKDAKSLYEAGEKKWGTDKSKFIQILTSRSNSQLKAIFEAYQKFSKKDIEADIKSETSGNLCKGLLTIVRIMRNRPRFFAYHLKRALQDGNIDKDKLNRVIISRCEVDMVQIKEEYENIMKRSLEDHIHNETKGNYREILLELLKDPNQRTRKAEKKKPERVDSPKHKYEEPEVYEEDTIQQGTMIAAKNFDANRDADALRKAMKGAGTDEKTIINILGNRTTTQRLEIKSAFKTKHNRDLTSDLKSETSGNFKKLLERLMMNPVELDCFELKQAVQGVGTDEEGLIEILASRSNKRIRDINETYKSMYTKTLEKDVKSDTSGDFRLLLVSLMQGHRPETAKVNIEKARQDAQSLTDAGSEKFKTDRAKFNVLYCDRSDSQLKAIFNEFGKLNGKSIEDVVKKETKGDHQKGILAIIRCIQSRPHFFAERLRHAVQGVGTKEAVLNRIIITRSEVDLVQIKAAYKNLFNRELERDVSSDTSGDYAKLLLELLKDPSKRNFN